MNELNNYNFNETTEMQCLMPAVMKKLPTTGKPEGAPNSRHLYEDTWLGSDYMEVVDINAIQED